MKRIVVRLGMVFLLVYAFAAEIRAQNVEQKPALCEWSRVWPQLMARFSSMAESGPITDAKARKENRQLGLSHRVLRFIDGVWRVELAIDAKGVVRDAQVVSRPEVQPPWPEYEEAILKGVRTWRYEPGRVGRQPRPTCTVVTFGDDFVSVPKELAGIPVPVLIKEVKPSYTRNAQQTGLQGEVLLKAVILADGTVGDVAVLRSLDTKYGLDQEAINSVKRWRFKPAMKDGTPVAVPVSIAIAFTLK